MADNVEAASGSGGPTFASDELTYSGDTAHVTIGRLVHVTGSEGSKTYHEIWKAEDAAHGDGDYGLQLLAVRSDTLAALAGTTGDYTPLQVDADGSLYVNCETLAAPLNVVGGGTEATALRVTLASDSTGTLTVDTAGTSGLEVVQPTAADLNVTEASAASILSDTSSINGKITACNTGAVVISSGTISTITNVVSVDDNAGSLTVDTTGTTGLEVVQPTAADLNVTEANSGSILTALQTIDNPVSGNEMLIAGGAVQANDVKVTLDGETVTAVQSTAANLNVTEASAASILSDTSSINGKITACNTGAVVVSSGTITTITNVVSVDDNAGSLTVDTTGTAGLEVVQPTAADLNVTEASAASILSALQTIDNPVSGNEMLIAGGATQTNDVKVTLDGESVTVDLASNNDVVCAGDIAHDTGDSGNPIKIGAKATNSIEGLTQVAANDRTDLRADLNGILITRPHTTLEEIIVEQKSDVTGNSTAFTNFAAGGSGIHNYVTTIVAHNSSSTDGYVDIRDGTAGTVLMTIPLPAAGGATINLPVPLKGGDNTALAFDVSAALSTVYLSLVGFQAKG